MALLRFDLGDWSNDGHGKTQTLIVESSHSGDDIAAAYHAACRDYGINLHEDVCAECQEYGIKPDDLHTLLHIGWTPSPDFDSDYVLPSDVWSMFVHLVRLGNPEIRLEEVEIEPFFQPGDNGELKPRTLFLAYGCFG